MLAQLIARFLADESGANSVEYAIFACFVALGVVVYVGTGLTLADVYEGVGATLGRDPAEVTEPIRASP